MAWLNLREEIEGEFAEFTTHEEEMCAALEKRRWDKAARDREVRRRPPRVPAPARPPTKDYTRQRSWKARMLAAGNCGVCGRPRDPKSKTSCAECLLRASTAQRTRKRDRKRDWTKSPQQKEARKRRRAEAKAAGLCTMLCGQPRYAPEGARHGKKLTVCKSHYTAYIEQMQGRLAPGARRPKEWQL